MRYKSEICEDDIKNVRVINNLYNFDYNTKKLNSFIDEAKSKNDMIYSNSILNYPKISYHLHTKKATLTIASGSRSDTPFELGINFEKLTASLKKKFKNNKIYYEYHSLYGQSAFFEEALNKKEAKIIKLLLPFTNSRSSTTPKNPVFLNFKAWAKFISKCILDNLGLFADYLKRSKIQERFIHANTYNIALRDVFSLAYPSERILLNTILFKDISILHNFKDMSELSQVVSVLEFRNIRFSTSFYFNVYYSRDTKESIKYIYTNRKVTTLDIITTDNAYYNYVDMGRGYFGRNFNGDNLCIFTDIPFLAITEDVLKSAFPGIGKTTIYLNNGDISKGIIDDKNMRLQTELRYKTQSVLNDKLKKKSKEVFEQKKSIKINDISISLDEIKYIDQVISISNEDLRDRFTHTVFNRILDNIEAFNFDLVLRLLSLELQDMFTFGRIHNYPSIDIILGNILVSFSSKSTYNKLGIAYNSYSINDVVINKDEIVPCISKAINYTDVNDYNKFLQSVNQCSLKISNILENGYVLKTKDYYGNDVTLSLTVVREKNKNYIKVKNKKYKIKDSNALLRLLEEPYNKKKLTLLDIFNKFLSGDIIEAPDLDDLYFIKNTAEKDYVSKIKCEENLLKRIIETNNIRQETVRLQNYKTVIDAYIVTGKLQTYCIEPETNYIYSYPDGRYICMIDKNSKGSNRGNAILINRLLALVNDNLVYNQIETLKI